MKRSAISLLIIIFGGILLWQYRINTEKASVIRVKDFSIKGEFQYPLSLSGHIIERKQINFGYSHYDKDFRRDFYNLEGMIFSAELPVTGSDNTVDFYIKRRKKKEFIKLNVFIDNHLISNYMIDSEIQKITVKFRDNNIAEGKKLLTISSSSPKMNTPVSSIYEKKKEFSFIISDLNVQGCDPKAVSQRYNYQKWVSDRYFIPNNASATFDLFPMDNPYLFFSYHIKDINHEDLEIPGDFSVSINAFHKNRSKVIKSYNHRTDIGFQMALIPLEKDYDRIEIAYKSKCPDKFLAVGNIMILSRTERSSKRDIFLICADTLRRDHLGVYGYNRDVSPNIDNFSEDAVVFSEAVSCSSWTVPAAFCHYIGQYPFRHSYEWGYNMLIPDSCSSAVESFQNADFITIGLFANPILSDKSGYAEGFDLFYENDRYDRILGSEITESAIDVLDILGDFNLFVNLWYFDPHATYDPPGLFSGNYVFQGDRDDYLKIREVHEKVINGYDEDTITENVDTLIDQYDSEIQYLDMCLGELFSYLKSSQLYDGSIIAFFSDHGEEFYEHKNLDHSHALFDESINIPLIFKFPGNDNKGAVMDNPVNITDIFPTIWDIMQMERMDGYKLGQNLTNQDYDRLLIATSSRISPMKIMLKKNNRKYIRFYKEFNYIYENHFKKGKTDFFARLSRYNSRIHPKILYFDLDKNPGEKFSENKESGSDRFKQYFKSTLKGMENSLLNMYSIGRLGDEVEGEVQLEIDPELVDALKSLGYIN